MAGVRFPDNAHVAAGLLEDPRTMLNRLNQLLEKVLTKQRSELPPGNRRRHGRRSAYHCRIYRERFTIGTQNH